MPSTSDLPSVSLPLGISFNNGFGRPWFANAPNGSDDAGTISVVDPGGFPLAGAPDPTAGGVFTGTITNRSAASIGGLTSAAVATALATKSPDLSIRAVFFAALADGSIQQVHVQKGVDQLAPPGSFTPIAGISTDAAESANPDVVTRVGMIFNWVPTRILYITDPLANRILALDISDESSDPATSSNTLFAASNARYLTSPFFDRPVDIAPADTRSCGAELREQYDPRRRFGLLRPEPRQQFDRPDDAGRPRCRETADSRRHSRIPA